MAFAFHRPKFAVARAVVVMSTVLRKVQKSQHNTGYGKLYFTLALLSYGAVRTPYRKCQSTQPPADMKQGTPLLLGWLQLHGDAKECPHPPSAV